MNYHKSEFRNLIHFSILHPLDPKYPIETRRIIKINKVAELIARSPLWNLSISIPPSNYYLSKDYMNNLYFPVIHISYIIFNNILF